MTPRDHTSRPSRRRAWAILAALYAGALLGAMGLFVAYRIHVHHATFAARQFFWLGDIYGHDDAIGFRMRPNRDGTAVLKHGVADPTRRIRVRTDENGFRIPVETAAGVTAPGGIAAIGCSCTFAHGVAAESSYVYLAGQLLDLPAHNLGVCSYSAVTSYRLLERHIAVLRPSVVVYGFGSFHVERSERPRSDGTLFQAYAVTEGDSCRFLRPRFSNRRTFDASPGIEAHYYEPKLRGERVRLTPARIGTVLPLALEDLGRALRPGFLRLRFETLAVDERVFLASLVDRFVSLCGRHDARSVLLFFPSRFGEMPSPALRAAVDAHRDDPRFLFVDCSQRLFSAVSNEEEYRERFQVPRDGHPNRFMHLEMARALEEALTSSSGGVGRLPESTGRALAETELDLLEATDGETPEARTQHR